jgi:fructosamine-3-kinase
VYRVELEDGRTVVAKWDAGNNPKLDIEGYMLRYLAEHSKLPVPEVFHSAPELLVMAFAEGNSTFHRPAVEDAAQLLADMHQVRGKAFGLERDTLIGGLHQPNPWADSWVDFFREQRLLAMARQALDTGRLPNEMFYRIEKFGERLSEFIDEPEYPSLLHGDIWTTNVIAKRDSITAFIDPAVYYGHPEIELAFITLFDTFGDFFFSRYNELRPIAPGFFEQRRDIYNLYPLLVHVRLFGGGYLSGVNRTLSKLGF